MAADLGDSGIDAVGFVRQQERWEIIAGAPREQPREGNSLPSEGRGNSEVERVEARQEKVISRMLDALHRRDDGTTAKLAQRFLANRWRLFELWSGPK